MATDRYSAEYRRACLEAGRELLGSLVDPGKGASHGPWTGEVFWALRLVAWGGGNVEDLAAEAGQKFHRRSDAAGAARDARKREDAPTLPQDAWERFLRAPGRSGATSRRRRPPPPPEPRRPPEAELHELLNRCVPVADDPEVSAWLAGRAIAPGLVAERALAVALPVGTPCPSWASWSSGSSWADTGYRLLCPTWTGAGVLASVRARRMVAVPETDWRWNIKACAPRDFAASGLVLASPAARLALEHGQPIARGVLVVEGEPDYLTMATRLPADGPGVFGLGAGVPGWFGGVDVDGPWLLGTDADPSGIAKARKVAAMLGRGRAWTCYPAAAPDGTRRDWNDEAQRDELPTGDDLVRLLVGEA